MSQKFKMGTKQWLAAFQDTLGELVRLQGIPGQRFSLCKIAYNAPDGLVGGQAGRISFHFIADGQAVEVREGELPHADILVTAEYTEALEDVRRVFTPEVLAKQRSGELPMPKLKMVGDVSKMPRFMSALHNRIAAITE
jgi:hypothetical protein